MSSGRTFPLDHDPFQHLALNDFWYSRGRWPCSWSCVSAAPAPPFVSAYRCRFDIERSAVIRVHVSADEPYELFLDGAQIGRGPERGEPRHWRCETSDLTLDAGEHLVAARVWSLGDHAPGAQMSVAPGFLLAPQDDDQISLLGTGSAPWKALLLDGYT